MAEAGDPASRRKLGRSRKRWLVGWALTQSWTGEPVGEAPEGINPKDVAWVHDLLLQDPGVETPWEARIVGAELWLPPLQARSAGGSTSHPSKPDHRWDGFAPGVHAWSCTWKSPPVRQRPTASCPPASAGNPLPAAPGEANPALYRLRRTEDRHHDPTGLGATHGARPVRSFPWNLIWTASCSISRWVPPGSFFMGSPEDEKDRCP